MNNTTPYINPDAVTPATIGNAKLRVLGIPVPLTDITARAVAGPITGSDRTPTFGPRGSGNPQIGTPGSAQSAEIAGSPYAMSNSVQLGKQSIH